MSREVVIITGLSGSGKSTVADTMEDLGFFCVDNIPVDLLPKLLEMTDIRGEEAARLALVIDLRQREFFPRHTSILGAIESQGTPLGVLFLEARDEVIVRRYNETRRRHPLAEKGSVPDGVRREREELALIKQEADWVIDTSDMNVHQLRDEIRKIFSKHEGSALKVVVTSFGFGRGVPVESDLVFDVRFLPNPHFVKELKPKDGRDPAIVEWLDSHAVTRKFLEKLEDLLNFLLPLYIREGKQYLTISMGCTGGRHRSVAMAEAVYGFLVRNGHEGVEIRHRDVSD
jgi:UPF0042 nucleotide-binding protein